MSAAEGALDTAEKTRLRDAARRIRESIIETIYASGSGHAGGSLSQTDVLVALYYKYLRIDPARPDLPERDRFVMSKGHGGLGLAAILGDLGFFPAADLQHFGKTGHPLGMHMDHGKIRGLEASTGSLGHGLGIAVGMALGAKVQKQDWRTFCLLSDGECYEGSTWEAVISAPGFGLSNLTLLIDRNGLTMDGFTESLMPLEPLGAKLEAFGWRVFDVDGHDFDAICGALDAAVEENSRPASARPVAIIARTVKGKGVDFMESVPKWHYGALDDEMYGRALASIRREASS